MARALSGSAKIAPGILVKRRATGIPASQSSLSILARFVKQGPLPSGRRPGPKPNLCPHLGWSAPRGPKRVNDFRDIETIGR
jgi:hypothetical protein